MKVGFTKSPAYFQTIKNLDSVIFPHELSQNGKVYAMNVQIKSTIQNTKVVYLKVSEVLY